MICTVVLFLGALTGVVTLFVRRTREYAREAVLERKACAQERRESQAAFQQALSTIVEGNRESTARVEKSLSEVAATNRSLEICVTRLSGSIERESRGNRA